MAYLLGCSVDILWNTLFVYYQCDAAGYPSLKNKIFETTADGRIIFDDAGYNFQFSDAKEVCRLKKLIDTVLTQ